MADYNIISGLDVLIDPVLFTAVVMPPLPPFDRIVADGASGRAVLRNVGFLEQDRFRLLAGGLVGMRQSLDQYFNHRRPRFRVPQTLPSWISC